MIGLLSALAFFHYTFAACPSGFIEGMQGSDDCYKLFATPTNWLAAELKCNNLGEGNNTGHLTSIPGAFQNMFIQEEIILGIFNESESWTGANTILNPGQWTWSDKTTFNYTNWEKGQPSVNSSNCGTITASGKWYSRDCYENLPYVCKIKSSETESSSCFCSAGYTYHQRNNFCYKLIVNSGLSFNDSEALCQFDGAHLASIHDDEENIFLNSFAYGINAWIGLYNNNGTWTWTDGTALGFSKFICGTPSPSLNCTSMYNTHSNADCSGNTCDVYGQWTNNDCNNLGNVPAAICKKPHY